MCIDLKHKRKYKDPRSPLKQAHVCFTSTFQHSEHARDKTESLITQTMLISNVVGER